MRCRVKSSSITVSYMCICRFCPSNKICNAQRGVAALTVLTKMEAACRVPVEDPRRSLPPRKATPGHTDACHRLSSIIIKQSQYSETAHPMEATCAAAGRKRLHVNEQKKEQPPAPATQILMKARRIMAISRNWNTARKARSLALARRARHVRIYRRRGHLRESRAYLFGRAGLLIATAGQQPIFINARADNFRG